MVEISSHYNLIREVHCVLEADVFHLVCPKVNCFTRIFKLFHFIFPVTWLLNDSEIILLLFISVGQIPVVQLNFAALSNETPFNRDTVESCVKEVLQALSRSVQAKRNVEFHFAGIGRLSIRESKVKMKFYKEFLRSMDGSGSLVHALSNVS